MRSTERLGLSWIPWLVPALVLVAPAACSAERAAPTSGAAMQEAAMVADQAEAEPGSQAGQPAAAVGRKLVRTARLELLVEDYARARARVEGFLAEVGGFLSDAEVSHHGSYRSGRLTLRVPAHSLDRALAALRALGRVEHESLATEDVTRQYVDTDARLRNLSQTESRLRELLQSQAAALSSILEVEREITRVRGEIEALTAQIQQLDERIALSTVHLGMREEAPAIVHEPDDMWRPMRSLGRNALAILEVSVGALIGFLAAALTALLYALPWLVPVALVLAFRPRWRRALLALARRRERAPAPAAKGGDPPAPGPA